MENLAARLIKWLKVGGYIFFRESCFHQSGDSKRKYNPTHYREPRFYTKVIFICSYISFVSFYPFETLRYIWQWLLFPSAVQLQQIIIIRRKKKINTLSTDGVVLKLWEKESCVMDNAYIYYSWFIAYKENVFPGWQS